MQHFLPSRVLIAALVSSVVVGGAAAQVTFPGFGSHPIYTSNATWSIIGWRSASQYVVFQTELNGVGATDHVARYAVNAVTNTFAAQWHYGDAYSQVPLATQSAPWLAVHPSSGMGSTRYTFPGPYFPSPGHIPTVAALATHRTFTSGGKSYTVHLDNFYGPIVKDLDGNNGFRKAKFTLKIRRGSGTWHVLQQDAGFFRSVLMYGIDRIVVSPDGQKVAVFLVRYNCGWNEGWNVMTERMAVTGKLP